MPITKSGMWIFEKQKLMDKELIEDIKLIALQLQYYNSIATPENPYDNKIKTLKKDLFDWQSHAIFYAEYDIFENLMDIGWNVQFLAFRDGIPHLKSFDNVLIIRHKA